MQVGLQEVEEELGIILEYLRKPKHILIYANFYKIEPRLDIEYSSRKNNRLKRLIKNAGLDQPEAGIMDIN